MEGRGQSWEVQGYRTLRHGRDRLLARPARWLAAAGVPPWAVSLGGVGLAATTCATMSRAPRLALAAVVAALVADALDGAVARESCRSSGRGKLLDHACDAATFSTLLLATALAGLTRPAAALAAALLTTATVALALVRHARHHPSAWRQDPRAGFAAHLPKAPFLTALLLHLTGGPNWIPPALALTNATATAVAGALALGLLARIRVRT
jgi:phosphatidylglycerophosphate synthase